MSKTFPQIVTCILASAMMVVASSPTASANDDCAGGYDAGDTFIEAWPLSKGTSCSGAIFPGGGTDFYFVDEPLVMGWSSISTTVCSGSYGHYHHLYFLPAGSVLPWLGTDLVPPPFHPILIAEDMGYAHDDGCTTMTGSVDPAAGGRWYVAITMGCPTCGSRSYSVSVA